MQCQVCSVKCAVKIVGCGVGIGGYSVECTVCSMKREV